MLDIQVIYVKELIYTINQRVQNSLEEIYDN